MRATVLAFVTEVNRDLRARLEQVLADAAPCTIPVGSAARLVGRADQYWEALLLRAGMPSAMGAQLGGKVAVALMEGSGLGLSGLILARSLVQRSPLLLIASHDRALGEQFDYHAATRLVGSATLDGLGIPWVAVHSPALIETTIREALLTIKGQRMSVGIFVPRHVMMM